MKRVLYKLCVMLCGGMALYAAAPCSGASRSGRSFAEGYRRFDDAICRFLMGGMDSAYVSLPSTSWEIPVVAKTYGYSLAFGPSSGRTATHTVPVFEIGAGIGYHGLDLVYTEAVGRSLDYNFEFDYYDNYWGLGINVSRRATDDRVMDRLTASHSPALNDREAQIRSILLEGYYAVFGSRYSLPAAMYGNYIQTRSAGSPVISFWYEHCDCFAFSERAADYFAPMSKMDMGAVTAGYGYNFSIARGRVLLNLSAGAGALVPCWGVAATGRLNAMFWINENFRIWFGAADFYQRSLKTESQCMTENTWRANLALVCCFGKNRR